MGRQFGTVSVFAVVLATTGCPPDNEAAFAGLSVSASDSVRCGSTRDIYINHTTLAKELFVRVSHDCLSDEVPSLDPGRIFVRDTAGNVVNRQAEALSPGETHRGSFLVPGGGSLRVECPDHIQQRDGCPYSYTLTLRF